MKRKIIRNVSVFIVLALASGWMGLLADNLSEPQPASETPGMGIWLVLPLLLTIVLRTFAGDGWKDIGFKPNLNNNLKWYVLSIIVFPVVTALVLLIGKVTGWIHFSAFNPPTFASGFASVFIINFIKNIFEEFVWRGYLTVKLLKLQTKDIWLYLIVGGVWGIWHLPYYLFFLPEQDINLVLPVSRITFALIAIVSMICWSVMFIELYRITRSIWSVVILHAVEDSFINHLIIDGHILIAPGKAILVSPIVGIITTVFYLIVGLLLRKNRIKKEKTEMYFQQQTNTAKVAHTD